MLIKNKIDQFHLLIDIAIPYDSNMIQREAEMKLKYKSLSTEI